MTEEEIRAIVRDEMAKAARGTGGPGVDQTAPVGGGRVLTLLLVAAGVAVVVWLIVGNRPLAPSEPRAPAQVESPKR
jgi:hypothetical protein